MKEIVILGSGGFAKEVVFLIEMINKLNQEWKIIGFIDAAINDPNGKFKVVHNDDWLEKCDREIHVAMGVGEPSLIKKLHDKFKKNKHIKFPNLIHPNAVGDWERIEIGEGNIVTSGVNFTTDIKVGSFNIFNLCCTIGHDAVIGNYNVFNPTVNLSGSIVIESGSLIGTGSQILQNKIIKSNIVVGAGAVVTKDLLESGIFVGSPAKKLSI